MIWLLHGYLLEGSGSNLWTRNMARGFARAGVPICLFSQERHPENYDFISKAFVFEKGKFINIFDRKVNYKTGVIHIRPDIGKLLPVFVWDQYEGFERVVPMPQLTSPEIEGYIKANLEALFKAFEKICRPEFIHANHVVLMPYIVRIFNEKTGIPYGVMPHGSAIEYVVRKDKRFQKFAELAFEKAKLIFVLSEELKSRLTELWPSIDFENKTFELRPGVDTALFKPVEPDKRQAEIKRLIALLENSPYGKKESETEKISQVLRMKTSREFLEFLESFSTYETKLPDEGLIKKLNQMNWENAYLALFVGRLIPAKGPHLFLLSLPLVFEKFKNLYGFIVGHGPMREYLEVLVYLLKSKNTKKLKDIVLWTEELERLWNFRFKEQIEGFFNYLEKENKFENYLELSQRFFTGNLIFTGFLSHEKLRHLFSVSDVAVFPSLVKEAGPLVFFEAISSGCFPIGLYTGGMKKNIDFLAGFLPERAIEMMKIKAESGNLILQIARRLKEAKAFAFQYKRELREIAVKNFDWLQIVRNYISILASQGILQGKAGYQEKRQE